MSIIILTVDEVMRTFTNDGQYPFVVKDKTVDIVRFALNTGFTDVVLDEQTALRVMYQRPGETEVRAQTLTYYDTDGLRNYYDWQLLSADLTKKGTLTVALCILRTDSEVEEWHTTPCQIRVLDTIHTDDSDEADETITPTVAQRVAVLESMIQRVASGAPIVVSSTSAMIDTTQIYVLSTDGNWYYHNGTAWVAGGEYGAVATDATLTQSGIPADAKSVGDKIAEEIAEANWRLDGIDTILETGMETITVPVEAYGINASTGKNTSSSYWQYYRTAGFYKGSHVKATSTKGTLRSRIYFYASENVDTFISTTSDYSQTDLDEDVVYPEGATCFRVSGFVNGNPDNPLDLSAVTVEIDVPSATNAITKIKSDIADIKSDLSETSEIVKKSVVSAVDTDTPYNLIPSDMEWTDAAQINTNNGEVISHTTRLASGFIPIDASKQYLQIHIAVINKEYNEGTGDYIKTTVAPFVDYQYAFYDENKAFVASTSVSTDYVKVIPTTAKYVRVTLADAARKPFARLIYADSVNQNIVTVGMMEYKKIPVEKFQMPLTGYESFKMLCFGDSITHGDTTGNNDGLSYVNYSAQYLNADIESVGFGSTTAAKVSNTGTGLFCFPNLCDCIVSDDPTAWDALDSWAASGNTSYAEHLARLKAVDWSQVKAISILYGANDWAQNIPVGNDYNTTQSNYDGGIAYGITKLLEKYPHLQVMILSPFYRSRTTGGETVISDDANGAGLTMMDYTASLKNVQKKLHVPVVDSANWGINYLTMKVMSVDGTHPITDLGKQRIGHWFASAVATHLSPI